MDRDLEAGVLDSISDLSEELSLVEKGIEFCFSHMRSPEAATAATERLQRYKQKLEEATDAYLRRRVGFDSHFPPPDGSVSG